MTPESARSSSPRTPVDGQRSPFRMQPPMHSPLHPPSPELTNLDSPFPAFPSSKPPSRDGPSSKPPSREGPAKSPSRGGPSSKPPSRDRSATRPFAYAEADPMYAPVSPMTSSAPLLQRMKSIAPGPFDVNGRTARMPPTPNSEPRRKHEQQPSTTSSGHSWSDTTDSMDISPRKPPREMPRAETGDGYGGMGASTRPAHPHHLKPENRSQTFPTELIPPQPTSFPRRPSEPGFARRPSNLGISESASPARGRQADGPDRSRPPPPRRGTSLIRKRDPVTGEAPPMPDLEKEFGAKNPYHTPSASASSNESISPTSSPRKPRRPADTDSLDALMKDIHSTAAAFSSSAPHEQFANARGRLAPFSSRTPPPESPMDPAMGALGRLSPGNNALPLRNNSSASTSTSGYSSINNTINSNASSTYTSMSNASTAASSAPSTSTSASRISLSSSCPTNPTFMPPPTTTTTPTDAEIAPSGSTSPISRDKDRDRGTCKACTLPIKGKFLSSADGRLTGRYHKQCFVCTTCRAPFSSQELEFYVLHDAPYCARHYHELNGSLCAGCGVGIEGQYLETEAPEGGASVAGHGNGRFPAGSKVGERPTQPQPQPQGQKFHPGCLKCSDCRAVITPAGGYWEMAGRVFCERDAVRRERAAVALQLQRGKYVGANGGGLGGGGNGNGYGPGGGYGGGAGAGGGLAPTGTTRMEKRSTRLMMM